MRGDASVSRDPREPDEERVSDSSEPSRRAQESLHCGRRAMAGVLVYDRGPHHLSSNNPETAEATCSGLAR